MIMKIEISDIVFLLGLCFVGAGLYFKFDLGTALSVLGFIVLLIGFKMAPKRRL